MRGVMQESKINDGEKRHQANKKECIWPQPANAQLNDHHAHERDRKKRGGKRFRVERRTGPKTSREGHTNNREKDLRDSREFHDKAVLRVRADCAAVARVAAGTLLYFNTPGSQHLGGAFRPCSIQKEMQ